MGGVEAAVSPSTAAGDADSLGGGGTLDSRSPSGVTTPATPPRRPLPHWSPGAALLNGDGSHRGLGSMRVRQPGWSMEPCHLQGRRHRLRVAWWLVGLLWHRWLEGVAMAWHLGGAGGEAQNAGGSSLSLLHILGSSWVGALREQGRDGLGAGEGRVPREGEVIGEGVTG